MGVLRINLHTTHKTKLHSAILALEHDTSLICPLKSLRYKFSHLPIHFGLFELIAHTPPHAVECRRITLDKRSLKPPALGQRPFEATCWSGGREKNR